jgi:hypothetical protein
MNIKMTEDTLKNKISLTLLLIIAQTFLLNAQPITERYSELGEMFIAEFSSAPFPHQKRATGHTYKDEVFPFEKHYNDSSVAIFITKDFKQTKKTNFVVYFHGWGNNIDKSCAKFNLIEQFTESNKNAIFVFPEGPKNAKDSFGGKLEEKDGLIKLINDVVKYLLDKGKLETTEIGNIILAGHSGAYRVISFCISDGGLTTNISEVILFDALYGNTAKYLYWIENYNGKFINIYTNYGGTKNESENMMKHFDTKHISYIKTNEVELLFEDLSNNRLIFIHSDLKHSEVIGKRNQFMKFLKSSALSDIN